MYVKKQATNGSSVGREKRGVLYEDLKTQRLGRSQLPAFACVNVSAESPDSGMPRMALCSTRLGVPFDGRGLGERRSRPTSSTLAANRQPKLLSPPVTGNGEGILCPLVSLRRTLPVVQEKEEKLGSRQGRARRVLYLSLVSEDGQGPSHGRSVGVTAQRNVGLDGVWDVRIWGR